MRALLRRWRRWSAVPGGKWLFSRALSHSVPYTGSIGPRVLELRPGHATIALADRRRVRNHLDSVHAIAIANLGELASGLALNTSLPDGARAILTGLDVGFHKKARGRLIATSDAATPVVAADPVDVRVKARIVDAAGDTVATVQASWRVDRR